jgi:hypothetical protein
VASDITVITSHEPDRSCRIAFSLDAGPSPSEQVKYEQAKGDHEKRVNQPTAYVSNKPDQPKKNEY